MVKITIRADEINEAEKIAMVLINNANKEKRYITVSKTRKGVLQYKKTVLIGDKREINNTNIAL